MDEEETEESYFFTSYSGLEIATMQVHDTESSMRIEVFECYVCGCVVKDTERHVEWHEAIKSQ